MKKFLLCYQNNLKNDFFRYVNDSPVKYANSVMKRYCSGTKVYLNLYALKDIEIGTELR